MHIIIKNKVASPVRYSPTQSNTVKSVDDEGTVSLRELPKVNKHEEKQMIKERMTECADSGDSFGTHVYKKLYNNISND